MVWYEIAQALIHFGVHQENEWGLCQYVTVHTILPPSPVILWVELGGKPKWLPLNFEYHDVMCTSVIPESAAQESNLPNQIFALSNLQLSNFYRRIKANAVSGKMYCSFFLFWIALFASLSGIHKGP